MSPWVLSAINCLCVALLSVVFAYAQFHVVHTAAGSAWEATGGTCDVEPGQLCQVVDVQPAVTGGQLTGTQLRPSDVLVLVQLYNQTGPVVALPAVNSTVTALLGKDLFDVHVQHLPVRLGWAMTVPASQGMEFDKVVLDLTNATWLDGGGYTGIGRVKGKLRDGLRIKGGGEQVHRFCFRANADVLLWFMDMMAVC